MFRLEYLRKTQKDFRKIPKNERGKIREAYNNRYRLRVGDYRVIYEILTKEKFLVVHAVHHRKDAYHFFLLMV